jgi:hypothetical protein
MGSRVGGDTWNQRTARRSFRAAADVCSIAGARHGAVRDVEWHGSAQDCATWQLGH